MATRLYLHNDLFDTVVYPGSYPDAAGDFNQTGSFPGTPSVTYNKEDAVTVHRSMSKTKGNTFANITWTTTNSSLTQMNYITHYISEPLKGVTQIDANTWNMNTANMESNASANILFIVGTLFVWRPSTNATVGVIEDYTGFTPSLEPSGVNTYHKNQGDFTSGISEQVTGVQDGDVLVLVVYSRHQQSAATAYTAGYQIDGTDEAGAAAQNASVSDFASYIETPQNLGFVTDFVVATSDYKDILKQRPQTLITNSI